MAVLELTDTKLKMKLKNLDAFMQEVRQKFEQWKKAGESRLPLRLPIPRLRRRRRRSGR